MRRFRSLPVSVYRSVLKPVGRGVRDIVGLVPALLAGGGVFLVVAGLFYYLQPVAAAPAATPTLPPASVAPYSLPPRISIAPSSQPSAGGSITAAIATRITIPAIGIDLPIVTSPPNEQFPLCNAAEYLVLDKPLAYPGLPQATYIYAHARTGMFGPLYFADKAHNLASLIGLWVQVYTSDDQDHVYQISETIPGVSGSSALERAGAATTDQLWMQTSEGPYESSTKLQVVAEPIGVVAATAADAHPTGKGNVCPDAPICKTSDATGCRPS